LSLRDGGDDHDLPMPTGDPSLPAVVFIEYEAARGESSGRAVAIQRIWRHEGLLYMQGVCHLRHQLRTFRVDRISELICLATGEVTDKPADWLEHHAFLVPAPEADYTPHAVRRRRDELAILAYLALADGHMDPDEVEIAVDLVMMSTEKQIDRDRAGRYVKRLSPTALDLGEAVARVSKDDARWDCLRRSMRRLVDADGRWPIEEQLAVEEIDDLHAAATERLRLDSVMATTPEFEGWRRALGLRLMLDR
jgi:hypothetical protein